MKNYFTSTILLAFLSRNQAARTDRSTFVGPGVVECDDGRCEFSVDPSLGCADPCHTQAHQHMNGMAFKHVASTNSNVVVAGGQVCYKKQAENINSNFPDKYVAIEKGCTAKCTGCSFSPTVDICKFFMIFIHALSEISLPTYKLLSLCVS